MRWVFESLGLNSVEEAVFLSLVTSRGASVADVADELGVSLPAARDAAARLLELGFVSKRHGAPDRLTAVPPDTAVGVLAARRREEISEAERSARQLAARFPADRRTDPDDLVEVVVGRSAVVARFEQMMQQARAEMLVLDRPPYAQTVASANGPELVALERGVAVRGIYAPEAFELPGALEQALRAEEAGEQSRVHADVPIKLVVVDATLAMMPMTEDGGVESSLVVHSPMVVAALVRLFELLWRQAHPIARPYDASGPDNGIDRDLLLMLSTGMKDEAIARELGISVRTLGRRIARLLEALGARTRFQAGLQAHRADDRPSP